MRRRSYEEIQTSDQIPKTGYSNLLDKDYASLVPSFKHVSVYSECGAGEYTEAETTGIVYNNKYKYTINGPSLSDYHRDNYCMVPYTTPPMSLTGVVYPLDKTAIDNNIPRVSMMFDLEYDGSIMTGGYSLNLTRVVISAYPDYETIRSVGNYCVCDDKSRIINIIDTDPNDLLIGPIDSIQPLVSDVSDEYAYFWEDLWDMSVITTRKKTPIDDSEDTGNTPAVYLCRVVTPPSGSGGTATVEVISVSGSGAVQGGTQMSVNVIG